MSNFSDYELKALSKLPLDIAALANNHVMKMQIALIFS
jgi:poly-gamma-glutamate capsule biosynthesis protein CapA/YwtB (metallophosphatase superfamily)